MKKWLPILALFSFVFAAGCGKKEDPRERPDFVDTSDPSKVMSTMKTPKMESSTSLASPGKKK